MTLLTTRIETGSDKLKIATLVSFNERIKRIIDTYLDYYFNENTFANHTALSMTELLTEISLRKKTNK